MIGKVVVVAGVCLALLAGSGCRKSDSGGSNTSASASKHPPTSAIEKEAADAMMTEINRHWSKTAGGFVSAYNSGNSYMPNYLRELREIAVADVEPREASAAEKSAGTEWSGQIDFKTTQSREAGDEGLILSDSGNKANRVKGQWSDWLDLTPEPIRLEKTGGKWQFQEQTMPLRGTQPTPADYQAAGVKP